MRLSNALKLSCGSFLDQPLHLEPAYASAILPRVGLDAGIFDLSNANLQLACPFIGVGHAEEAIWIAARRPRTAASQRLEKRDQRSAVIVTEVPAGAKAVARKLRPCVLSP